MKDWKQALKEALPEAVAWRQALHRIPELAFREANTTAFIRRTLEAGRAKKQDTPSGGFLPVERRLPVTAGKYLRQKLMRLCAACLLKELLALRLLMVPSP